MTKTTPDQIAATELVLWAVNDGELYRTNTLATLRMLAKRVVNGTYDANKALIAWDRHATQAAKGYAREFASAGDWFQLFPASTRLIAAIEFQARYQEGLDYQVELIRTDV